MTTITAIKGFDKDLKCRGFQFEVGKTYTHSGKVVACESGFHATPDSVNPLKVFSYYKANTSRYCVVELSGDLGYESDKVAAQNIKIVKEISLSELINMAVKFQGDPSATASGYHGAATASGYHGAATASGWYGAATASGYNGSATASGVYGAATATGYGGLVKGAIGNALFAVERNGDYTIKSVACGIVGQDGIRPDTWYKCVNGKLVEV